MTEIGAHVSDSEWETLQQGFLEEGIEQSRALLAVPDQRFDPLKVAVQMRTLAGRAKEHGFHSIAELALRLERLLGLVPIRGADVREHLSDLFLEFCAQRTARSVAVPEHIAAALRGKSVALIGFSAADADRACSTLGRVDARVRLFTAADDVYTRSIQDCDLVVFRVDGADAQRIRAAAEGPAAGKLLLAGGRRCLMALPANIHSRVGEFLVESWESEELLLRLAQAISRKESAGGTPASLDSATHWAAAGSRQTANRSTVLIADDDPVILTLLRMTLPNYGLECQAVDNGREALRLIRKDRPQAVVLDINMPGLDGYGVLSAVRAENLPTLVVLLSARQQEEDVLRGFRLGADDYIVKPFNPPELVARIKRLFLLSAKAA